MSSWWMQEDMTCIDCGQTKLRWMAHYYHGIGFQCRTCEREQLERIAAYNAAHTEVTHQGGSS